MGVPYIRVVSAYAITEWLERLYWCSGAALVAVDAASLVHTSGHRSFRAC